jgi:hypothetical protein
MADSYAFNIRPYQTIWGQNVDNVLGFMQNSAAFAIYNTGSSGKIVRIKQIDVFGNHPGTSLSGGSAQLQRISAVTVGSGRPATPLKMDSNNADPTNVTVCANPDSVTLTANSLVRSIQCLPLAMATVALPGSARQFPCCSEVYDRQAGVVGQVQPITLNQNQGLCLDMPGNSFPMAYGIGVRFRQNSLTYWCSAEVSVIRGFPMWTIFNADSTYPVEIERITVIEIGLAVQNKFEVEFIDNIDPTTGGAEDVIPMDSAVPLPSTVKVMTTVATTRAGANQGGLVTKPLVRSVAWFHQAQDAAIPFNQTIENAAKYSMFGQNTLSETVLYPGKGIAVYERMGSNMGLPAFRGVFTVENIPTGGGAAPVARSYIG